jgi:hypothetical protein
LSIAADGSIVLILDGPREDENLADYTWWLIRDAEGIEGWVVQEFLEPALPPEEAQE